MTKKELLQYRRSGQELDKQNKLLESYISRLEGLPVYAGTVQSSQKDFPYIRTHITIDQTDPVLTAHLESMIEAKKQRIQSLLKIREDIEDFIKNIDDSTDRQIFELVFVEGKTHQEAADIMFIERSTVSRRIDRRLKNSHKSHFD